MSSLSLFRSQGPDTAGIRAIDEAPLYLRPLADGIARRMGCAVSIFCTVPIPDNGGLCGLRSVHVGHTPPSKDKPSQDLLEFDPAGCAIMEARWLSFGNAMFRESLFFTFFILLKFILLLSGVGAKSSGYTRHLYSCTSPRPCSLCSI